MAFFITPLGIWLLPWETTSCSTWQYIMWCFWEIFVIVLAKRVEGRKNFTRCFYDVTVEGTFAQSEIFLWIVDSATDPYILIGQSIFSLTIAMVGESSICSSHSWSVPMVGWQCIWFDVIDRGDRSKAPPIDPWPPCNINQKIRWFEAIRSGK